MDKLPAAIIAIAISLLLAVNYHYFFSSELQRENVIVARVIDGDTLELRDGRTVRLLNINAPEKGNFAAALGKEYLSTLINKSIEIQITGTEKYGRFLGRIYSPDYVNLELVKRGFVSIFLVDTSELKEFNENQQRAIRNSLGMWNHSENYRCLTGEINKKLEYVILTNNCDVSVVGWTIKDESTKVYVIKREIKSGTKLYSKKGTDNESSLYWNKESVWNDDRDSIIIRDSDGQLVYFDNYGY